MKFLVVDDESDVENLWRQKLRREIRDGVIDIQFALSGQEALDILHSQEHPDVVYIFSDINMPGMTGLDLLKKVKTEFPQINISMISAYGDKENFDQAKSSGAKEFFTKPVNFDTLKSEIIQILES
jgi:CheY-like chemotaxis protein